MMMGWHISGFYLYVFLFCSFPKIMIARNDYITVCFPMALKRIIRYSLLYLSYNCLPIIRIYTAYIYIYEKKHPRTFLKENNLCSDCFWVSNYFILLF